ncbi:MAG TPA: RusA family crossover junction endodeoxyribonuclease [Nitrospira sp.]|jgi:crossover junction endodeoxyribonuclease RusA
MRTYRRPLQIPASKLPLHLIGVHRLGPLAGEGRPAKRLILPSKSPDRSVLPDPDQQSIALILPIPPSINHQYATVNGRRLLSSTGRSYKAQVGQLVWLTLTAVPHRTALLSHLQSRALALSIRFYFTSALRRDVDGGLKIAQDALCEGLGLNDNRIVETHLYKHVDRENPRIEVLLTPAALS